MNPRANAFQVFGSAYQRKVESNEARIKLLREKMLEKNMIFEGIIGSLIDNALIVDDNATTEKDDLYSVYKKYCEANKVPSYPKNIFFGKFYELFFCINVQVKAKDGSRRKLLKGFKLKPEYEELIKK